MKAMGIAAAAMVLILLGAMLAAPGAARKRAATLAAGTARLLGGPSAGGASDGQGDPERPSVPGAPAGPVEVEAGLRRLHAARQQAMRDAEEAGRTRASEKLRAATLAARYKTALDSGIWPVWVEGVQLGKDALASLVTVAVTNEQRHAGYESAARARAEALSVDCSRLEAELAAVRHAKTAGEREETLRRAAAILEQAPGTACESETDRIIQERMRKGAVPTLGEGDILSLAASAPAPEDADPWRMLPDPLTAPPALSTAEQGAPSMTWADPQQDTGSVTPPSPRDSISGGEEKCPAGIPQKTRPPDDGGAWTGESRTILQSGRTLPPQCLPARPDPSLATHPPAKTIPRPHPPRTGKHPYNRFFP